ncbi:Nitrate transport protein NrtA precursor [Thalassovita gelatinovora]|uniref:Nitrate transport protein NrtA n=1 Tax=Thalassovita gelatinovora TaxID=53501 RepID=A0A0P1FK65_THAGE|nr:CmpA/NrtA family ABC transporter substrate-binding protein [Thalassovita gelatinovora]QIZ82382.1 ABC transporter substrate-binding protein [Thalassovita gelatinovora]CUH68455.1 Nitrate transport protein NrtA precursor [Thalassovita gelatinovora]SEQ52575.1 NitT/TauT family transport system ATP-binding protein [Thalassovita gelatinovora]
MSITLNAGYIPLVDAAPLIIAHELGFGEEEGLALNLHKAPSWSTLRDLLALGQIEAAHMLAPVPVATALGIGGMPVQLEALSVLSVNGNVIGVSPQLALRLREHGYRFDFKDATAAGRALIATKQRLRIGVPFPFSMHAELLFYWLNSLGLPAPQALVIRTVPPPLMAQAMANGEIDAFCVGEPWGSIAVENGVGELLLPGNAIWNFAPEKVLATRKGWADADPDLTGRLVRAVWRAGRWLGQSSNTTTAAEILSRTDYLGVSAEVIDRALSGRLVISARGGERKTPRFVEFFEGAATFPWKSQAAWIGGQIAARLGLDRDDAMRKAREVFRSDLHRQHLSRTTSDLPGASEKIEGSLSQKTAVASESGKLFLLPDQFFDGRIFDPTEST